MSHVDNVVLSFSILEGHTEPDDNTLQWDLLEPINEWLEAHAAGQRFGPELGDVEAAYGGGKVLEAVMFVAAFNFLPEDDFITFLGDLPWRWPGEVQIIIRRQHDDLFEIIRPCLKH